VQIGIFAHTSLLPDIERDLRSAHDDGVDSFWISQGFGHDALSVIAAFARELPDMRVGTAVIPVYPRHPMALAQQALTVNHLTGGNLVVGLGSSHPSVVEPCWGMSYERPARYMREYLEAFTGSLTQHVRFRGEVLTARGDLTIAGEPPIPTVMVSALGPAMLRVAGRLASGTITWMVGRTTLRELTIPTISDAAEAAGRPAPEIVVTVPVCVTDEPERARREMHEVLSWYDDKPSYRDMLDREGFDTATRLAIIGSADHVREELAAYGDAGATTVAAQFHGTADERSAGRELIGRIARENRAAGMVPTASAPSVLAPALSSMGSRTA
jgi:F420-dependent oxidoreductase-like protein